MTFSSLEAVELFCSHAVTLKPYLLTLGQNLLLLHTINLFAPPRLASLFPLGVCLVMLWIHVSDLDTRY